MAKTEKPPGAKAPAWMIGGARGYLPAIPPGESDDAPDGLPAAKCTIQRVEADGTVVVMIDGEDEPTKVALADLEELPPEVPTGGPAADAAVLEQAEAFGGGATDPEPTEPLDGAPVADRARRIARLERQVEAAKGAAMRATAKFERLARDAGGARRAARGRARGGAAVGRARAGGVVTDHQKGDCACNSEGDGLDPRAGEGPGREGDGVKIEPKHMFGENARIRPWQNEPEAATARVWAFDDGKVWFCVDSHGLSLTLYGLTEDMRKLAALIVAAADASDAGRGVRDAQREAP